MVAEAGYFAIEMLVVAFAGGAIGAAIGGMAALSLSGLALVVGEVANAASGAATGSPAAFELTSLVGYGPALGPHVAFAGGVAAAAYLGRHEESDSFPYHRAKDIFTPNGAQVDALLAGGAFGVIGYWLAALARTFTLPVDPVMASVVVSGLLARIAFGYPLVGSIRDGLLDMSPYERREIRTALEGHEDDEGTRLAVEPWAPQQHRWLQTVLLGLVVGIFAAYVTYVTQRYYLAFGITLVLLGLSVAGVDRLPILHHIAFPASIVALSMPGFGIEVALGLGAGFGLASALLAEFGGRVLYAHADTHVDPPAIAIVVTTLAIGVLTTAGIFEQGLIPAI
ncbi:conserved hypothetical protein [Halorhabdus utahensis DSM 12940]|uniref:DUF7973 domain-containing protein n=1 Tax=Halorhabdus utahensis (strain DSM 12940 / JCM 11049 / AX-2) TaxID=519442 RepID=C7NR59_HALUD|nr:hypothetical protein [Halorhabdus utahensis]ACV12972.1 conserved hypothetical protein [Halorhabdus utahensis DSM 12940]